MDDPARVEEEIDAELVVIATASRLCDEFAILNFDHVFNRLAWCGDVALEEKQIRRELRVENLLTGGVGGELLSWAVNKENGNRRSNDVTMGDESEPGPSGVSRKRAAPVEIPFLTEEQTGSLSRHQLRILENTCQAFPAVDPVYVHNLISTQAVTTAHQLFDRLIGEKYPTIQARYRLELAERRRATYLDEGNRLDIEEFLRIYPDPAAFFESKNRQLSPLYHQHVMGFLSRRFPRYRLDFFTKLLERNDGLLLPVFRLLEEQIARRDASGEEIKFSFAQYRSLNETAELPPFPDEIDDVFFREVQFCVNEKRIKEWISIREEDRAKQLAAAELADDLRTCEICCNERLLESDMVLCHFGMHAYCRDCVKKHAEERVGDGAIWIPCMSTDCSEGRYPLNVLREFLSPANFQILFQRSQQEEVRSANLESIESCPFCDFSMIIENDAERVFRCLNPGCQKESCRECHGESHLPLRCDEVETDVEMRKRKFIEERMSAAVIRKCPRCANKITKLDGCNRMTCPCGASFCYVCGEVLQANRPYAHFEGNRCKQFSTMREVHQLVAQRAGHDAVHEFNQANPEAAAVRTPDVDQLSGVNDVVPFLEDNHHVPRFVLAFDMGLREAGREHVEIPYRQLNPEEAMDWLRNAHERAQGWRQELRAMCRPFNPVGPNAFNPVGPSAFNPVGPNAFNPVGPPDPQPVPNMVRQRERSPIPGRAPFLADVPFARNAPPNHDELYRGQRMRAEAGQREEDDELAFLRAHRIRRDARRAARLARDGAERHQAAEPRPMLNLNVVVRQPPVNAELPIDYWGNFVDAPRVVGAPAPTAAAPQAYLPTYPDASVQFFGRNGEEAGAPHDARAFMFDGTVQGLAAPPVQPQPKPPQAAQEEDPVVAFNRAVTALLARRAAERELNFRSGVVVTGNGVRAQQQAVQDPMGLQPNFPDFALPPPLPQFQANASIQAQAQTPAQDPVFNTAHQQYTFPPRPQVLTGFINATGRAPVLENQAPLQYAHPNPNAMTTEYPGVYSLTPATPAHTRNPDRWDAFGGVGKNGGRTQTAGIVGLNAVTNQNARTLGVGAIPDRSADVFGGFGGNTVLPAENTQPPQCCRLQQCCQRCCPLRRDNIGGAKAGGVVLTPAGPNRKLLTSFGDLQAAAVADIATHEIAVGAGGEIPTQILNFVLDHETKLNKKQAKAKVTNSPHKTANSGRDVEKEKKEKRAAKTSVVAHLRERNKNASGTESASPIVELASNSDEAERGEKDMAKSDGEVVSASEAERDKDIKSHGQQMLRTSATRDSPRKKGFPKKAAKSSATGVQGSSLSATEKMDDFGLPEFLNIGDSRATHFHVRRGQQSMEMDEGEFGWHCEPSTSRGTRRDKPTLRTPMWNVFEDGSDQPGTSGLSGLDKKRQAPR